MFHEELWPSSTPEDDSWNRKKMKQKVVRGRRDGRRKYSPITLALALDDVRQGLSLRIVSSKYGISKSTLFRHKAEMMQAECNEKCNPYSILFKNLNVLPDHE